MPQISRKLFSIIVPFQNEKDYLKSCVDNLNNLYDVADVFEVIFVNSASTNNTAHVLRNSELLFEYTLIELEQNLGPGTARNAGVENSQGLYVIFLDVDDVLDIEGFLLLTEELSNDQSSDVISFNWKNLDSDKPVFPRKDYRYFSSKCEVVRQYSRHHMEASVIFSTFKHDFLNENSIQFLPGLHEDISFLFEAYLKANKIKYFDALVYLKVKNPDSVTSTISEAHIDGYLENYQRVGSLLEGFVCLECEKEHLADIQIGASAAVASRLREISRLMKDNADRAEVLALHIKSYIEENSFFARMQLDNHHKNTAYGKILKSYLKYPAREAIMLISKIDGNNWSCKDLHHSVFFAPKEIRTCCKRFFVDGEIRGDVVLDVKLEKNVPIEPKAIQIAKRDLWLDINYGEPNACDQCPFLEFSDWKNLEEELDLHLISMEQHSVCNLRCTYCDDTFYGGARPNYDIEQTIEKLSQRNYLDNCELIVWGGGEPLLDPNFAVMLSNVNNAAPRAHNRILSNSLRHSQEVQDLLVQNKASLVTSLDAGTANMYQTVRGRKGIEKVFDNLQKYSEANSRRITVKYIFTRLNTNIAEIEAFCNEVEGHHLKGCYFQISSDFKEEWMTQEMLEAAILLYTRLRKMNVYYVYLDEHIWQRWASSHSGSFESLPLSQMGGELKEFIAKPEMQEPFFIWGTGQLTKMLFRNDMLSRWNVAGIVDSTPGLIGTSIFGFEIQDPKMLVNRSEKIFLSSVQSIVLMHEESERLGIQKDRLLQKLLW